MESSLPKAIPDLKAHTCTSKGYYWKVAKPKSPPRQLDSSLCFKSVLYMLPQVPLPPQCCFPTLAPWVSVLFSTTYLVQCQGQMSESTYICPVNEKMVESLFNYGWEFCLLKSTCILLSEIILQKLTNTFVILSCGTVSPVWPLVQCLWQFWSISNRQIISSLRAKVTRLSLVLQFYKQDVNLFLV